MTLEPLINASPAVQIHLCAVAGALGLTLFQLLGAKGSTLHRALGYAWACLMMMVAFSGFFIHTLRIFGPFSYIHLLSIFVLFIVPYGVVRARQGKRRAHMITMLNIVAFALVGAGLYAFFGPSRLLHQVLFGGGS